MKALTDTYCLCKGEKRSIGEKTAFHTDNAVIKELLKKTAQSGICGEIEDIYFLPLDAQITKEANEAFKNKETLNEESYIIKTESKKISVYASSTRGFLYAAGSLYRRCDGGICEGIILNIPLCEVRGIKLYLPSRENMGFFREFADMCMHYGYNTMYVEVGGAMEYKRHPEINEGWVEYCEIFREYNGKTDDVQNIGPFNKNSIHIENGGGKYLTQKEVKELVLYCRERGIEVIPEVPSLSHSDYLLTRHPELAENKLDPVPDVYCPSNEKVYELLFDVLDEIAEVFEPKTVHIAHDEWYAMPLCEKCAKKTAADLFAGDVKKIRDYLFKKGIKTMIWGDRLLNGHRKSGEPWIGGGVRVRKVKSDRTVNVRGKLYPIYNEYWGEETQTSRGGTLYHCPPTYECIEKIPADVLVMNWSFRTMCGDKISDYELHKHKLWSIYGNFNFGMTEFENWFQRIKDGVHGIAISNWSKVDREHMQRNAIFLSMVYAAIMLWNRDFDETKSEENIVKAADDLFNYHYKKIKKGSYVRIVHTSDVCIGHPAFADGYGIVKDDFKIGSYKILYDNGDTQTEDIVWGENIGPSVGLSGEPKTMLDGMTAASTYTREPTYTCNYILGGDKLYYELIVPVRRGAKKVIPEILEKYSGKLEIKSTEIINS